MAKYNLRLLRLEFWIFSSILVVAFMSSCTQSANKIAPIHSVEIETLSTDSMSIRAITIMGSNVGFAGSKGHYGLYDSQKKTVKTNSIKQDTIVPNFRAVASTTNDFFMLSIQNPALLYKTGASGEMELVYIEENEKAFYDAMTFWNDEEGIAMGDPTEDCLSIIITRDRGKSWRKIACDTLPKVATGEAAFAASDTNIAIHGDHTWIVTGGVKSRVFYSADKGATWSVFDTPVVQGKETTGGYSIDFYDNKIGFIIGGDYTNVDDNSKNKAITTDGGRTWQLINENSGPGYQSCVQFVPGRNGQQIVSVGKTGIWVTNNAGNDWNQLSKTGFYTFRFVNDTIAYAGGNNILAKLYFK